MINLLAIPGAAALTIAIYAIYENRRSLWGNVPLVLCSIVSVLWTGSLYICFKMYSVRISTTALYIVEAATSAFLPLLIWIMYLTYRRFRFARIGVIIVSSLYFFFLIFNFLGYFVHVEFLDGALSVTHGTSFIYYAYLTFNILSPLFAAVSLIAYLATAEQLFKRDKRSVFIMIGELLAGSLLLWLRFPLPGTRFFGCFFQTAALLLFYFLIRQFNISMISEGRAARVVFSSVKTPFLFVDINSNIFYANDFALELFGVNFREIEGRTLNDMFRFEGSRPSAVFSVKKADNSSDGEYRAETVKRNARCHLTVQCLWDRYDEFYGAVVEIRDISGEELLIAQLEQAKLKAEAAAEAKSNFLANTSHEIRTPMNAILGMVELILRKDISPGVYEDAMSIKQAGTNLLAIINDILDLSKIESGKLDIVPAPYSITSLINDCISIIRMRLAEKPVMFTVNAGARLPNTFSGDEVRVRQVILNLLSNAVKFTAQGCISFSINGELNPEKDNEIMVTVRVSDTGFGIKEEDMNRLFNEFVQLDSHRIRSAEGTGLGLAISRRLCRQMGGDLTVESRYGEGSVFTATFPQKVIDPAPIARVEPELIKPVLLREPRRNYEDSLSASFRSLRVPFRLTRDWDDFSRELDSGNYGWVFVAASLTEQAAAAIETRKLSTTVIALADTGENSNPRERRQIPLIGMPAWTVPIANVLNGKTAGDYHEKAGVPFIAPDARILIVDDISTNLSVATGLLALYQMRIDTSLSGGKAIEMVKDTEYDIILMDHMMPEMDGIEAAIKIREWEKNENAIRTPIIALTANAVSGMKERFLNADFDDFLSKPIEIPRLNEIMEKWIPLDKKLEAPVISRPEDEKAAPIESSRTAFPEGRTLSIAGIDVRRGIIMTGGVEAGYRAVVSLFCQDARERLPFLEEMAEGPEKIEGAALDSLIIQIHALKSAMAAIGADDLSAAAAGLEKAGREKDVVFLSANLSGFASGLSALVDNITAALNLVEPEPAPDAESRLVEEAAPYRNILLQLRGALEEENSRLTNRLLETLNGKNLSPALDAVVGRMADKVLLYEFEEAMSIVDSLTAAK
jgi:signal transduction histidine kinase/DNA-binding NarL/FixJ family response regulator/HPt (histidine-containing phosphotransfer) domain-containing protein